MHMLYFTFEDVLHRFSETMLACCSHHDVPGVREVLASTRRLSAVPHRPQPQDHLVLITLPQLPLPHLIQTLIEITTLLSPTIKGLVVAAGTLVFYTCPRASSGIKVAPEGSFRRRSSASVETSQATVRLQHSVSAESPLHPQASLLSYPGQSTLPLPAPELPGFRVAKTHRGGWEEGKQRREWG